MKRVIGFLFGMALLVVTACSDGHRVKRLSDVPYETVTAGLYTMMPGEMYCAGDYIVWTDPFSTEGFLHVVDRHTGHELAAWGRIGGGPEEFNTPSVSYTRSPHIVVSDLNKPLCATLQVERCSADSVNLIARWNQVNLQGYLSCLSVGNNLMLAFSPEGRHPFALIEENGKVSEAGEFPVEGVDNGFEAFQGKVTYLASRGRLLYSLYAFPYLALYDCRDGQLALLHESGGEEGYTVKNGQLQTDADARRGFQDAALTRDYVVGLQRDETVEGKVPANVQGRDPKALPHSLFVYDGSLKPVCILNLNVPIVRLCGDGASNELFAVVVNPEYSIVKIDLDALFAANGI